MNGDKVYGNATESDRVRRRRRSRRPVIRRREQSFPRPNHRNHRVHCRRIGVCSPRGYGARS